MLMHEPASYVMEALLYTRTVKTRHQRDYRVLARLSALGAVTKGPTKGHWSATPGFAASLRRLARSDVRQSKWSES